MARFNSRILPGDPNDNYIAKAEHIEFTDDGSKKF